MKIKITKLERESLIKCCAIADLRVLFYTDERATGLLNAEITDKQGGEPSNVMTWYVARQLSDMLQVEEFVNKK
jgi:hypothetical protein